MSIYQDLVELFGFTHRYNSVKRFWGDGYAPCTLDRRPISLSGMN